MERVSATPESPFLQGFFASLDRSRRTYCVLRNYERLPFAVGSSDIDMLTEEKDFEEIEHSVYTEARRFGGHVISRIAYDRVREIMLLGCHGGEWWGVRIDLFCYAGTNGVEILPSGWLLERRCMRNGVSVIHARDGAILALMKDMIGTGDHNKKYAAKAISAFVADEGVYEPVLRTLFGDAIYADHVLPMLTGKGGDIRKKQWRFRHRIVFRKLRKNPVRFCQTYLRTQYFRLRRFFMPPGIVIAFLGVDGAGKTTIIEKVVPLLEQALHCPARREHSRPNMLPSLARLVGRKISTEACVTPHVSKPSGRIGSLFRLSYYLVDYTLGYFLKVYPAVVKRPVLYVFDRYCYDYLIDPTRSRIALPQWILRIAVALVPKPRIVLCLGADPLVITERKPELPVQEVTRQLFILQAVTRKHANCHWVDTGTSITASVDQALTAIVNQVSSRYEKVSDG